MVRRRVQEAARRPPSTPGLNRRSGRIPALPYPPIKPLHCTAVAEKHQSKTIHSGRKQRYRPSGRLAEIAILAVLWRQGASTVREVHEALGKNSGYTTTLKLMQLMFEKGLVERNERYRSHVYEARAPKEQTQRQIAGDLLK